MTDSQLLLASTLCISLVGCGVLRAKSLYRKHPGIQLDQVHRKLPEALPLILIMIVSLLGMIYAYRIPVLSWHFPEAADRSAILLLWTSSAGVLSYLGAITATLALSGKAEQARLLTLALGISLLSINSIYIRFYRPIHRNLGESPPKQVFLNQSSDASCAAAAGASLVRLLGGSSGEADFARLAGTSMQGTNPGQSIFAFRKLGITAEKDVTSGRNLASIEDPAILLVAFPGLGPDSHAVLWVPESLGGPFIHDPYAGRQNLTTFQQHYPGKLRILRCRLMENGPSS